MLGSVYMVLTIYATAFWVSATAYEPFSAQACPKQAMHVSNLNLVTYLPISYHYCVFFVCFQFFNPGAFVPVNTLPQGPPTGTNPQEPQDDAVSIYLLLLLLYLCKL